MPSTPWPPERLARLNKRFEESAPQEILGWGLDTFWPDICLATSFGPQSIVLLHLIAELRLDMTIFYLDTGLLFEETYALRDRLSRRLGLKFIRLTPDLSVEAQASKFGPALWSRDPDRCCYLRKVLPLRRFLATRRAWITGIRNGQTRFRAAARLVEWDAANDAVKLNPLVDWPAGQVWDYIRTHDLPFNTLHGKGYPSIGCRPCTRPVRSGADPRSGRWPGFDKTECGIHLQEGTG